MATATPDNELVSCAHSLIESFISSFRDGASALSAFGTTWIAFESEVQNLHHVLQKETLAEIHSCVSTVGSIASGLLSLEDAKDVVWGQLSSDLTKIMDEQMGDLIIRDEQLLEQDGLNPVYIKSCYDWLLSNLHDPYPSKAVKKSISRQTGTSIKNIENWFADARKRIGWNHLRKTYFSNKQNDIVDAATRIFKPSQYLLPDASSATYVDHHLIFTEMQQRAINLYTNCFQDAVPELSTTSSSRTPCQKARSPRSRKRAIRASYPSPERTPDRSPSPIFGPSANCKRRRASPDTSDTDEQLESRKRPRIDSIPLDIVENCYLLSPAPSLVEPDLHDDVHSIPTETSLSIIESPKRKRKLSDAGDQGPAKRPTRDPLSLNQDGPGSLADAPELSLDCLQEFSENVDLGSDIPPPVGIWMPNDAPLNVQVHQYGFPPQFMTNEVEDSSDISSISLPDPSSLFLDLSVDAPIPDIGTSVEYIIDSPMTPFSWPLSASPIELTRTQKGDSPYLSNIKDYSDIAFEMPDYREVYYNTSVVDPLNAFDLTLLHPSATSSEVERPNSSRSQVLQECNSNGRPSIFGESKDLKQKRIIELRRVLQQLEAEVP